MKIKTGLPVSIATAIAALFLSLGIVEVGTRVLIPDPDLSFENRLALFAPDPKTGYKNRANFRGYAQGMIRIRTNQLGYRGRDVDLGKNGALRVLALGDSVTWGVGVQEEQTYIAILERLANQSSQGAHVQTLNSAVIGYSTHQELLTFERDGPVLQPDLAIVGFVVNDFYPTEDPFFNIHLFHQPSRPDVKRRLYQDPPPPTFYSLRLMRSVARNVRNSLLSNTASSAQPNYWGEFQQRGWPHLQAHFRRMKQLTAQQDCRLLILLFPASHQMQDGSSRLPQSILGEFLAAEKIDSLDLIDLLRAQRQRMLFDNTHLTPVGHTIVARAILERLQQNRWITK